MVDQGARVIKSLLQCSLVDVVDVTVAFNAGQAVLGAIFRALLVIYGLSIKMVNSDGDNTRVCGQKMWFD